MDEQNKSMNERWAPGEPDARGYASDTPGTFGSTPDASTDRRTAELRSEIERTRADMSETIDSIQDRVRPGNVAARTVENVREAAMGKARSVANSVQQAIPEEATNNPLIDRIRENPMAAAIAGASLAWLMFSGRGERRRRYTDTVDHSPGYAGEYEAYDPRLATMHESGLRTQEARQRAAEATRRAGEATRRARSQAQRFTRNQPLAAAGVAAVAGLALGFLLPETERENQVLGEARDQVMEKAREAARTGAERVKDTAQEVAKVATRAISANDKAPAETTGRPTPETGRS
jgi:ElaB/YqjD/DUF883 family membrane-anchored ribosome-binding protein